MSVLVIKTLGECDVCGARGTVTKLLSGREQIKFCPKCKSAVAQAIKIKAKEIRGGK